MSLFHNVIKAEYASQEANVAEITTDFTVSKKETVSSAKTGPIDEAKTKVNQLLEDAVQEKEQLLQTAQIEAENIKDLAQQTGFEEGKNQGYQEGYAAGYAKATEEGQKEAETLKQSARQMVQQAEAYLDQYYVEKQDQLIQLAATMAEIIVHQTIDASSEQVLELVKPLLIRMNKTEKLITVTVRPEQAELVQEKLTELEQKNLEVRFVVLADHTLEKNGCVIETAHNITDLQIGKQLEKMVADMKAMR
ncbi:flagellar assembly protein FliH [Desemzia sp. RIT804]|uniref:FliH/SctL family protein n=1 Tax=Desemzia sp. RIT 804 TaxID=2810209 RepID=UPI00195097EA|nr:FliH/SctL family protein [Desemzia sp. RIT 804]MBM6614698.1 flagellar assembly protein FliH [Desemzia sp. RIT 804]